MKKGERKKFFAASAVFVGSCIGAGVLGIPYVAARSGFFVGLGYILLIGLMILLVNLYLGEVTLRTKGNHQLPGYAEKYLGKRGKFLMEFAMVFIVYAAITAYLLGISESLSFLIFGNARYVIYIGVLFGLFMSFLIWGGLKELKRFEKAGVVIILFLLLLIFVLFSKDINVVNLYTFDFANIFLPFGVVLFALLSFTSIPEMEMILKGNEKLMKKALISGTLICIIFYALFTFVVVGFKGMETPQIATLALGPVFILLGIVAMFTSYLVLGNALQDNFLFDNRMKKYKAWLLTAIIPIGIFLFTRLFDFFSFTKILGIGGVVSGGIIGILSLFMIKNAKKNGDRKPEYKIPINWIIILIVCLIFILGALQELFF